MKEVFKFDKFNKVNEEQSKNAVPIYLYLSQDLQNKISEMCNNYSYSQGRDPQEVLGEYLQKVLENSFDFNMGQDFEIWLSELS